MTKPEHLEPLVLHPRPFCGEADGQVLREPVERKAWVFCPKCRSSGPPKDCVEDCVMAWNKRTVA